MFTSKGIGQHPLRDGYGFRAHGCKPGVDFTGARGIGVINLSTKAIKYRLGCSADQQVVKPAAACIVVLNL